MKKLNLFLSILFIGGLIIYSLSPESSELEVPADVGGSTKVGYHHDTPPPWPRGNCFSLKWEDRHVVNMHEENFSAIKEKLALKTIKVERIGEKWCIIVDPRIPKEWFLKKPCSICTPTEMQEEILRKHADSFLK